MDHERTPRYMPAPRLLVPFFLFCALFLGGCATSRYERGAVLAGDVFTETLLLSGEQFRLERESDRGRLSFTGTLEVEGDEWRFAVESWSTAADGTRHLAPAVTFVYRGRVFENGIAFYVLLSPRHPSVDFEFIRAPCDFDLVR